LLGLKVCLVPLTHETKYVSGTIKFVDLLEYREYSDPQDTPSYGPVITSIIIITASDIVLPSASLTKTSGASADTRTCHWYINGTLTTQPQYNTLVASF